jgi:hypothetical protein
MNVFSLRPAVHILYRAYNLGNVLREDPTKRGLLYFLGCLMPMMNLWNFKMYYDSRYYVGDDVWHRLYEIFTIAAIGTAVVHIRPVAMLGDLENNVDMFAFCCGLVAANILAAGRLVEVMIFQKVGTPELYPEAFLAARRDALSIALPALFYVAAMVYTAVQYYGNHESSTDGASRALAEAKETAYEEDDTAIWLCLSGAVASVAGVGVVIFICFPSDGSHKKFTVPMNIGYCIHRYGEWTMLMLGETVLSLLIVDLSEGFDYYKTFFSGIISIILLEYLHFRSQPHDPDEHAWRRDKNSSFVFLVLMQVYSASLIILGASYKMLLYEYVYAEDGNRRMLLPALTRLLAGGESAALRFETDDRRQRVANFFCGSMALVFFCMDAMSIAHRGISANVHRCECEATQKTRYLVVLLIALRVAVIGFIASLSQYTTAPGVLAFVGMCVILVQLFLRVMGSFAFPVNEEEEEDKVYERIAVHTAARVRQSNT